MQTYDIHPLRGSRGRGSALVRSVSSATSQPRPAQSNQEQPEDDPLKTMRLYRDKVQRNLARVETERAAQQRVVAQYEQQHRGALKSALTLGYSRKLASARKALRQTEDRIGKIKAVLQDLDKRLS